jgi:hypothetical protein
MADNQEKDFAGGSVMFSIIDIRPVCSHKSGKGLFYNQLI